VQNVTFLTGLRRSSSIAASVISLARLLYVKFEHLTLIILRLLNLNQILDSSAKLLKATVLLACSCPSVRTEQFCSHWTDFHEILYLRTFLKSVEKIRVSLKSDEDNGYFT
jgi:hypothetical protein